MPDGRALWHKDASEVSGLSVSSNANFITAAFPSRSPRTELLGDSGALAHVPSSDFLARVFENSACLLLVVDAARPVQRVLYASPAFLRLGGYTTAELCGRPWGALSIHENTLERRMSQELLYLKSRNQTQLCFDAEVTCLRNEDGAPIRYIVVLHDKTAEQETRALLEYRAHYDALTGLANRYLLRQRFDIESAHAQRRGETFSLALLDLNGFKAVNDTLGHHIGDAVLREVGARLKGAVRDEDTAARVGGDEFALLLSEVDGLGGAESVRRVGELLSVPVTLQGSEISVTCSCGIAQFPRDGTDFGALLKAADARLYAAKRIPGALALSHPGS